METTTKRNPVNIFLIIVVVLLIGIIVYLIFDKNRQKEKTDRIIVELKTANFQRDSLETEFRNLYDEYEYLKTDNDTLNKRLAKEQKRIDNVIREMRSSNTRAIAQYKKELATLRQVMRGYVVQLDSLNRLNQDLTAENIKIKTNYRKSQERNVELSEEVDSLASKVEIASELQAQNIQVRGLNRKERVTSRASKLDKLEVCCELSENSIAPKGYKDVYIRIARPDGEVLSLTTEKFTMQGSEFSFSAKRRVNYDGEPVSICVYWKNAGDLTEGNYAVDIFADGKKIGESSIQLR